MSYWIKVSVKAATDPILAQAGLDGLGLWLMGQCYCGTHHSDGFIPSAIIPDKKLAQALVKLGIWSEQTGGYLDPGFLTLNDDRVTVEAQLQKASDRMARAREVRANKSRTSLAIDLRPQTLDDRPTLVPVPQVVKALIERANQDPRPQDPSKHLAWVKAQSHG
jgi:hypothetical protein